MQALVIDVETYSSVDLIKRGIAPYFASNDAEIIVERARDYETGVAVNDMSAYLLENPLACIVAHNAEFERAAYSVLKPALWGQMYWRKWICTSAMARYLSLPGDLRSLCKVLGTEQKEAGSALIKLFCMPQKDGQRVLPNAAPERFTDLCAYCDQDVIATRDATRKMRARINCSQWDAMVSEMQAHYHVQEFGCPVDADLVNVMQSRAIELGETSGKKVKELTGLNATQNIALAELLGLPSMNAATVSNALDDPDTSSALREVLLARQDSTSASLKKLTAIQNRAANGRLRNWAALYGASRTHRFAGRGVQPQNLPRGDADASVVNIYTAHGASVRNLVKSLRSCFVPNAEHGVFHACDYSNIESRILAWLAGETWKLDIFRASDIGGPDLYTVQARAFNGDRQAAKVAELACGFGGGANAFAVFASAYKLRFSIADAERIVGRWRAQNPLIVNLWYRFERAFKYATLSKPGVRVTVNLLKFTRHSDAVTITLPSGRNLWYWQPREKESRLSYVNYQKRGARIDTYGGRITENVVQAIGAELLLHALNGAHAAELDVYLHGHDEIVCASEDIKRVMLDVPAWVDGMPVGVKMHALARYAK